MCSQYNLRSNVSEIGKAIDLENLTGRDRFEISPRGYLKTETAPVIYQDNGKIVLNDMYFSLCPTWSKEFPFKSSTYNARMESEDGRGPKRYIYEKPSFRESFAKGWTCLVPMNGAIESSYFGTHAGQVIEFTQKADRLYFCAGIYSPWLNKETGEILNTFSLLTDDPYEFFLNAGHDRSIFILKEDSYDSWLADTATKEERFKFLRENRVSLDWEVNSIRDMKPGWQKRAPRENEVLRIKSWPNHNV